MVKKGSFGFDDIFEDFDLYLRRNSKLVIDDDGFVRHVKVPDQLDFFDNFINLKCEVKK